MKQLLHKAMIIALVIFGYQESYAQYCTAGPSSTADSEIEDVILTGDNFSISNLATCPGLSGVANYTATDSADISLQGSYNLTVKFGTCGGSYAGAGQAWIDWNQNQIFEASESVGQWSGQPAQTVTFNFCVPANATLGKTRMRVMQWEGGTLPLNPCGSYTWGAVEDYSIVVTNTGPSCPIPGCLDASSITASSAVVSWLSPGSAFNIEYGPAGFTQGNGTTTTSTSTSVQLNNLSANTAYDVYVQNNCTSAGNGTSGWSSVFTFSTVCTAVDIFPYSENFDSSPWAAGSGSGNTGDVIEPCWSRSPVSPAYFWGVRSGQTGSSGTGPNSDFSTTGNYLFTEGSNTGDSAFMYTPQFILDSLNVPYFSFKYHMFGNNMGTLAVQADTGTGWVTLWSLSGQQQTSLTAPWIDAQIDVSSVKTALTSFRFVGVRGPGFATDMAIDELVVSEAPPCPVPSLPVATNITDVTADLSWTSSGTNFNIEYGPTGFTPGVGSGTVVNVTGTSTTLSSLLANTDYDIYLTRDCTGNSNGYSNTVGPIRIKTLCSPSVTYFDNFDSYTSGQIPDCFSTIIGSAGTVNVSTTGAFSAPARVQIYNSSNTSTTTALVSPTHSNLDQDTMQVRFQGRIGSTGMSFYVGTLRDNLSDTSLVIHDTITPSASNQWNQYIVELNNVPAGHQYIAFVHPRTPSFSYVYIDDYNYEPIPTCTAPTGLTFIGATTSSANLYWTQGGSTWSQLEWGVKPHTQGTGSMLSVNNDTANIGGLQPNTTYQVWVRDSCGPGVVSPWFGPIEFTTPCPAQSMPYVQDFESWPVSCWTQQGTFNWVDYVDASTNTWAEASFWNVSSGYAVFQSPVVSITQNAWVKFDWSHLYSSFYPDENLILMSRIAGTATWDTLLVLSGPTNFNTAGGANTQPSSTPDDETIYLPTSYTGNDAEFLLWANTDFGPDLFVDNFEVSAVPPCVGPANYVTDSVDGFSAGISWYTPNTGVTYNVEWGLQGYSQGTGAWIGRDTVSNPNVFIQSLTPTTCYDVWVQSDCGAGVKSAYVKYSFCTTVSCPAPSNINLLNVNTTSATIGWTSGGSSDFNIVVGPAGTTPATGTVQFGVTNNPLTIPGLTPATNYDFWVRDSCGVGDVSTWEGPFNFTTPCLPSSLNYSESFAGNWLPNGNLLCWDMSGGSQSWEEDAGSGSAIARFWSYTAGNDMVMTSPIVTITQNARLRFKWSHLYSSFYPGDSLAVLVKDTSATATWDTLWAAGGPNLNSNDGAGNTSPGSFVEDTVYLNTSYTGSAVRVRFYAYSGYGPNLYVDDVILEVDPNAVTCPAPQGLTVSSITDTSASLGWTGGSGPWQVAYSQAPFSAGTATIVTTTSNPLIITGLTGNTQYAFAVREICSTGDTSLWAFPQTFRTACASSFALPYQETYNNWNSPTSLPCWDMAGGTRSWGVYQASAARANFWGWTSGNDAKMTSSVINLSGMARLRFKWSHQYQTFYPGDSLTIMVKDTSVSAQWVPVWQAGGPNLNSNDGAGATSPGSYVEDTVMLDPSVLGQYVQVQFHAVSGYGPDLFIDEMNIEVASSCGTPSNLMTSNVGCDTVEFSWTPVTGAVYSWVEYGNAGFTPGTGTVLTNPSNPVVITGLTPGSTFDIYV
ncbi:MAG: fibronectin type III domain-containing protein, partial [Bacteroidota bacterium]|nr:fibronectin type III domain-containing protein [Bacteroidota bacterium]